MQFELIPLKNGLNTLFVDAPGSTAATAQIWFRAGSALETKGDEGIAHFLEHMFFKGTKKRPGAKIAHDVESFGGEINAFTSFDYTCYYINAPQTKLLTTVEILLDMVSNPQFKDEDFTAERGVVFEEYRRSQDNSNQYSFQRIQKNAFTKGYAHPILGNEKTIKNFNRKQLLEFRNKFYNLSNAMLVIAGDLKQKDKFIKKIESFKLPSGKNSIFPEFKLKTKPTLEVHHKDVRMSQVTLTIQSPHFSDDVAAAEDLAISCMGHGETSRLYKALVLNESLANSASSSTMFMEKGGVHFIRTSFPHENLDQVLSNLYATFKKLAIDGLSKEEVEKIKNQYVSSKIYEKESLESFAFSLGHGFAQAGDIHSDEGFIKRIREASVSDVNTSFNKIFSRAVHVSVQIPKEESLVSTKKTLSTFQEKLTSLKNLKNDHVSSIKYSSSNYDPQVKVVNLKKGINLIYRQNKMNPTFVMHAYLKGGLTEEFKVHNGAYHLLSGVITKGYKGMKYEQLKLDLEHKAASLSGFSGKNAYGLTMHGQTEHAKDLFKHFLGSFENPLFGNDHLKHEKSMTLRHIENQKEDPIKHCFKKVTDTIFHSHPYSLNVLGTPQSISKVSKKYITDLHNTNIQKKEVLFTYCGDLDLEEVINLLKPMTTNLKPRGLKKPDAKKYKSLTAKEDFIPFDREQTQIFHYIPSAKLGSKENIYLQMMATHLSGQSSELFVEVRDKQGLCYSAQPVHFTALEGGYWGIYMASGFDKVKKAVPAISDIIEKFRKNGLSKKDFGRIKSMIEGQSLLNVQTNEDYANIYSVPFLQGQGLDWYYKNNISVENLSYEDFQKSIQKIFSRKWSTVLVGREGL